MRTYRGVTIEKLHPSGMWSAFLIGYGYLRADTLAGLKAMIREALNGHDHYA